MKKKFCLCLLTFLLVLSFTGCDNTSSSSSRSKSNTFEIKDVKFTFDQDSEFHDFKYKNDKNLPKDESKQSLHLEYVNKDIYDGRFVYRIVLSFSNETNLKEFLDGHSTEKVKINGITWDKATVSGKTDNKDTTSIVYATEKNSTLYVVTIFKFTEANINTEELAEIFINGVTIK